MLTIRQLMFLYLIGSSWADYDATKGFLSWQECELKFSKFIFQIMDFSN